MVGISAYDTPTTGWAPISGTNDVALVGVRLADRGFDLTFLTDGQATKQGITEALDHLAASTAEGDTVYIHFSGHGQLFEDFNGDEPEGVDQSFVCFDACFSPDFEADGSPYYGQNHFIDDEIYAYVNRLKSAVGTEGMVVLIFDSCFSGGAERGDIADAQSNTAPVDFINVTRGASDDFRTSPRAEEYLSALASPGDYSGGGTLTVISACQFDHKNFECRDRATGQSYGSLSYCLATMLDQGIPMGEWGDFFDRRAFRAYQIFRTTQKPVSTTIR